MRKIYLDELPRKKGFGATANKDVIDWQNSAGRDIKFTYDDIDGMINIINFNPQSRKLTVEYNNIQYVVNSGDFQRGHFSHIINLRLVNYKYIKGEIVCVKSGEIEILEQITMSHYKQPCRGYKYKCLVCNHIDIKREHSIIQESGCPVCSNLKIIKGYNDFGTTHPQFVCMLKDPNDAFIYGSASHSIVNWQCPNCKSVRSASFKYMSDQQFRCSSCSDKISYANKFMREFFNQIRTQCSLYQYEKTFSWSKNISHENNKISGTKIYDNYIEKDKIAIIVEIHGIQHYKESFFKISPNIRTLHDEQLNDELKRIIALKNNIDFYIEIDGRYSNCDYIRNNILCSKLSILFDLSEINWVQCDIMANKSLVIEACEHWNRGVKTKQIAQILKIHQTTALRYLHQGNKLNICNYNGKTEKQLHLDSQSIAIVRLEKDTLYFLDHYKSIRLASRMMNTNFNSLRRCCNNKQKSAGGFKWMYSSDYYTLLKTKQSTQSLTEQELEFIINYESTQPSIITPINTNIKPNLTKEVS